MSKLADWLIEQCESRNLAWGEASTRADLAHGTISGIINGQVPGLKVCIALADFFGVTPEFILRLAGHLDNPLGDDDTHEIAAIYRRLSRENQTVLREIAGTLYQAQKGRED